LADTEIAQMTRERTDGAEREGSSRTDKEAVGLIQSNRNHRKRAGEAGTEGSNGADREYKRKQLR